MLADLPEREYPEWVTSSVHLPRQLRPDDFNLPTTGEKVTAHVIGVIENHAPTKHLTFEMQVQNGEVHPDMTRDIAKIELVERHQPTGRVQVGLVHGFGLTKACAIATTVAHDSHQMIVVGTDEKQMALAANHLAAIGGGQVVISEGRVLGEIRLPIGGLMSKQTAQQVAAEAAKLLYGFRECGCTINNPNMTMSLLGLVVIPQLRISDMGLVDVDRFDFIPVLEPEIK